MTVINDGRTISVPLSDNGVTDGFEGAQVFGEPDLTAAHFASADATATVATAINDEFFVATSFERLTPVETPLTGTATAVGTGVSVLTPFDPVESDQNSPAVIDPSLSIPSQVSETITLNVDFDGVAQFTNSPEVDTGTYSGLFAGSGGDTIVGAFELPGRVGVFQATTD